MTSFYILYSFTWFHIYLLCFYPLNSTSELSAIHATITVLQEYLSVYSPAAKSFIFSYAFMLLSSAFLFHFHGCPWACVDLVLMNSLSFCLSRKVFISPSFLKDDFAGYSILSWQVYSFSALNISSHSLLSCIISAKKFSDNIMGSPLWHLCLAAFRSLSLSFDSLNTKVWASLDSSSLESLDVHFLPQIWGVLAISSSSKLSVSLSLPLPFFFWDSHYAYIDHLTGVSFIP